MSEDTMAPYSSRSTPARRTPEEEEAAKRNGAAMNSIAQDGVDASGNYSAAAHLGQGVASVWNTVKSGLSGLMPSGLMPSQSEYERTHSLPAGSVPAAGTATPPAPAAPVAQPPAQTTPALPAVGINAMLPGAQHLAGPGANISATTPNQMFNRNPPPAAPPVQPAAGTPQAPVAPPPAAPAQPVTPTATTAPAAAQQVELQHDYPATQGGQTDQHQFLSQFKVGQIQQLQDVAQKQGIEAARELSMKMLKDNGVDTGDDSIMGKTLGRAVASMGQNGYVGSANFDLSHLADTQAAIQKQATDMDGVRAKARGEVNAAAPVAMNSAAQPAPSQQDIKEQQVAALAGTPPVAPEQPPATPGMASSSPVLRDMVAEGRAMGQDRITQQPPQSSADNAQPTVSARHTPTMAEAQADLAAHTPRQESPEWFKTAQRNGLLSAMRPDIRKQYLGDEAAKRGTDERTADRASQEKMVKTQADAAIAAGQRKSEAEVERLQTAAHGRGMADARVDANREDNRQRADDRNAALTADRDRRYELALHKSSTDDARKAQQDEARATAAGNKAEAAAAHQRYQQSQAIVSLPKEIRTPIITAQANYDDLVAQKKAGKTNTGGLAWFGGSKPIDPAIEAAEQKYRKLVDEARGPGASDVYGHFAKQPAAAGEQKPAAQPPPAAGQPQTLSDAKAAAVAAKQEQFDFGGKTYRIKS